LTEAGGPPLAREVVCLHGLGRSPSDWDGVADGLGAFGEVRAPRIPRDPGEALEVVDAAVSPGAIVIAHSIGGTLALRLSRERGRRFAALVLTDSFFPPARNGRGTAATLRDYASHRVAYLRELRRASGPAPDTDQGSGRLAALAGLARLGVNRADFDAAMASVTSPVLVVHARDDHHVPVDFALAAAARHPAWDVRLLDAGGHHGHLKRPDLWLVAVMPWLDGVRIGNGPPSR
jgi:pimeloyl-ACP methyl ester carboxylesterase